MPIRPHISDLLRDSFARRAALTPQITNAFRCIQRGEIFGLDCAIDYYARYLCVWDYDVSSTIDATQRKLDASLPAIATHYGARGGVIKRSVRNPHHQGFVTEQRVFGEPPPEHFTVCEYGLQFHVTLTARQHVGLFLDQRENRQLIRKLSQGKTVANLFAYTCSFSIAAAAGECRAVTSVDVARPSLQIGRDNFLCNHLSMDRATFCQHDVRRWLCAQIKKGVRYDLLICDPPTYASTRAGGVFSLADAWPALVADCRAILAPGGVAIFSNNHQAGSRINYRSALAKHFRNVEDLTPPPDFPVLPKQPDHVRMFFCRT